MVLQLLLAGRAGRRRDPVRRGQPGAGESPQHRAGLQRRPLLLEREYELPGRRVLDGRPGLTLFRSHRVLHPGQSGRRDLVQGRSRHVQDRCAEHRRRGCSTARLRRHHRPQGHRSARLAVLARVALAVSKGPGTPHPALRLHGVVAEGSLAPRAVSGSRRGSVVSVASRRPSAVAGRRSSQVAGR